MAGLRRRRGRTVVEVLADRLPADLASLDPDREPFPIVEPHASWLVGLGDQPIPGRMYRAPDGTVRRAFDRQDPTWRQYMARSALAQRRHRWVRYQPEAAGLAPADVSRLVAEVLSELQGRDAYRRSVGGSPRRPIAHR